MVAKSSVILTHFKFAIHQMEDILIWTKPVVKGVHLFAGRDWLVHQMESCKQMWP